MRTEATAFRLTTATLTQSERLRGMRKPTSGSGGSVWPAVIIFGAIIVLVIVAVHIAGKFRHMLKEPGPRLGLFNELSAAHELTRPEQKALRRLIRREKIGVPAKVFVQSRYLKAYAGTNAVYKQLYEKIFVK